MQNLIIALILAIFITAFALLNSAPVNINFVIRNLEGIPLSLVILISVLFGVIISAVLALIDRSKLSIEKQAFQVKNKEKKSIAEQVKKQEEQKNG